MYVLNSHRAVYFRAPGTGSTTFLNYVEDCSRVGNDHSRPEDHENKIIQKHHDWEKFTVIRNPYKWALSFHTMCARADKHWEEWCDGPHVGVDVSLEDFLEALKVTPLSWLSLNGELIGSAYKIEDLDALRDRFGIKNKMSWAHVTNEEHKGVWTPKALRIAKAKLGKELAFYSKIEEPEAQ